MKIKYTNTDNNGKVIKSYETEAAPTSCEGTINLFYGLADMGWKIRKSGNKIYCTLKDEDGKVQYVLTK